MGISLLGLRVYLDSNSAIYAVEQPQAFPNLKTGLVVPIDSGDLVVVTSELTLLETLVRPRRLGDVVLERAYRDLLTKTHVEIRSIGALVLDRAIDLRVLGIKTPDAIHIATGMIEGCDVFLTRDRDWGRAGVTVVDPADVA